MNEQNEESAEQNCDKDKPDILRQKEKIAALFKGRVTSSLIDDLCGVTLFLK